MRMKLVWAAVTLTLVAGMPSALADHHEAGASSLPLAEGHQIQHEGERLREDWFPTVLRRAEG